MPFAVYRKRESTSKYGFSFDLGGKNGGVLSMHIQVILESSFARPGSAPIVGGKKGEFRDWTTTQAVQTIRASLSRSCFRKLVGIDACHAKQTGGDKHVTIQNKAAASLKQEEDVEGEKDQDEMEEVDEEEEDDNSSSFVEDSD